LAGRNLEGLFRAAECAKVYAKAVLPSMARVDPGKIAAPPITYELPDGNHASLLERNVKYK
jgi:hypothetical protein